METLDFLIRDGGCRYAWRSRTAGDHASRLGRVRHARGWLKFPSTMMRSYSLLSRVESRDPTNP